MVELREVVIGTLLVGLFLFAIVNFGSNLAIDNDVPNVLMEDESFNRSFANITSELEDVDDPYKSQSANFFKSIPVVGQVFMLLEPIFGAGKVFVTSIRNIYTVMMTLLMETFGISPVIFNTLIAIVLVTVVLLAWRLYRVGS